MGETTTEVRADIELTRARMSGAIAELERKVDVTQRVRDHPWTAVGVAFGAAGYWAWQSFAWPTPSARALPSDPMAAG